MYTANLRSALAAIVCLAWLGQLKHVEAQEKTEKSPAPITPEQFEKVHKLIKPQPGESRWREIPWETSLWEARRKAAAEGKPIVVWTGSGGAPACNT
jgi:hypothetical protein